ncbi:hypothetical protein [Alkalibacillus salilacus]|uniref:Lipopolysaccharide export LptBFGC system permease protein LptF n=1 Tax=Alkalibacillus salilacus TaxID=284582 RepID=A0ABT9VCU9_9BACI|nr:hypothetical protein [Alkalibacillus salilacus]MDQ0158640.1 lipopolysaccharide export LptBFGC system permease protein LptF [Alkalibacillus salilacus]
MSNDDQQPKDYSQDDNYFEQNNGFNQSYDPVTGVKMVDSHTDKNDQDVEFASDTATMNPDELDRDKIKKEEKESHYEEHVDAGWGWIALSASFISFFVWTFLFALIGIVMGIYAKRRGANTLGNIAIGAALVAVLIRLFVFPLI